MLDHNTMLNIEADFIIQKIYQPTKETLGTYIREYHDKFHFTAEDQTQEAAGKVTELFELWKESDIGNFPKDDMLYLLKNTITRHSHGGEDNWAARLYTQINFSNELGLIQMNKDESIKISSTGRLMISEYENGHYRSDSIDLTKEESAFLIAFSKYQINNPYRSNTVKVNFFPLVLQVIKYLKENYNRPGIAIGDIPLILCWPNNDYEALSETIYNFRNEHGYNIAPERLYKYAMSLLDESVDLNENTLFEASDEFIRRKSKEFKFGKIINETPDEIIRKLRLTMLVSFRGEGNFIDFNNNEINKINHIINTYSRNQEFNDIEEYYNYMGNIDENLVFTIEEDEPTDFDLKEAVITDWATSKDWDFLEEELRICTLRNRHSKDQTLSYIEKPVRLEFLTAIILKKALPDLEIVANYITDDVGIPYHTASGERRNTTGADIDIFENNVHVLVEPTLSKARSYQVNNELPSIETHLLKSAEIDQENSEGYNDWFALFISPKMAKEVGNNVAVRKLISRVEIYPWETTDFLKYSKDVNSITDYRIIRDYAHPKVMPN